MAIVKPIDKNNVHLNFLNLDFELSIKTLGKGIESFVNKSSINNYLVVNSSNEEDSKIRFDLYADGSQDITYTPDIVIKYGIDEKKVLGGGRIGYTGSSITLDGHSSKFGGVPGLFPHLMLRNYMNYENIDGVRIINNSRYKLKYGDRIDKFQTHQDEEIMEYFLHINGIRENSSIGKLISHLEANPIEFETDWDELYQTADPKQYEEDIKD